jgi:hypothetical protein
MVIDYEFGNRKREVWYEFYIRECELANGMAIYKFRKILNLIIQAVEREKKTKKVSSSIFLYDFSMQELFLPEINNQ